MGRFQKNPYLSVLRELGATDYQIRVIRQLSKEFEEKDLYREIAVTNETLLGGADRPVTLNYASAAAMARHGLTIKEIIGRYRAERDYVEKGGVSLSYIRETERMAAELSEFGYGVTPDEVRAVLNSGYRDTFFDLFTRFTNYKSNDYGDGVVKILRLMSVIFTDVVQ